LSRGNAVKCLCKGVLLLLYFVYGLYKRVLESCKLKNYYIGISMLFLYIWMYVQIILESLPVSSSGHVALVESILHYFHVPIILPFDIWKIDFLLHGPTIVILLIFFFNKWWKTFLKEPVAYSSLYKRSLWYHAAKTIFFVIIADGITFLFWLFQLMPSISLSLGFCITAMSLYVLRFLDGQKNFDWRYIHAIYLGLMQGCSLTSGISRFATTYTLGCFLGYKRQDSFALSFLIQMPLLCGAFFKAILALRNCSTLFKNILDFKLLFVILSATLISYVMLYSVDILIRKKKLWYLSWYMMLPIFLSVLV